MLNFKHWEWSKEAVNHLKKDPKTIDLASIFYSQEKKAETICKILDVLFKKGEVSYKDVDGVLPRSMFYYHVDRLMQIGLVKKEGVKIRRPRFFVSKSFVSSFRNFLDFVEVLIDKNRKKLSESQLLNNR